MLNVSFFVGGNLFFIFICCIATILMTQIEFEQMVKKFLNQPTVKINQKVRKNIYILGGIIAILSLVINIRIFFLLNSGDFDRSIGQILQILLDTISIIIFSKLSASLALKKFEKNYLTTHKEKEETSSKKSLKVV